MAVLTDPIDFTSLWGADGLGWLVGIRDATTDATGRKNAVNWAYLELAGIKAFWRVRSSDYTSSSSPALAAGTRVYNVPSDYDDAFRLYYRENGVAKDVKIVSDSEWLERSRTQSTDADYPRFARLVHNGTTYRVELDRPISATFISSIGTLTFEYFCRLTQLSGATDEPILPPNLRTKILPVAAYYYALTQSDWALADRLRPQAEEAKEAVLKYDIERTARPRQIRPFNSYAPADGDSETTDYNS